MRAITKIRRSIRAISPVISVLLMIAIAVAASLVAYAWVMGYLGGTTTKVGRAVLIQSMAKDDTGNLLVYVQNVGQSAVTIDSVYVDDVLKSFTPDPNFADNKLPEGKTASLKVDYVVPDSGQVKVKVVTTEGTFTESKAISSGQGSSGSLNIAPTAAFSFSPTDPEVGETVTFTDASTDSDGSVVSWAWTFGDGGVSTLQSPTHSFGSAGTYTVRLTVTDDDGATNYVEHDVTVAAAPAVLDHFDFDIISGTKTSGTAFSITIRAKDQYDAAFTSYTGTNTLTYSAGTISPTTTTGGFTAGVWTGSVTVTGAGTGVTIGTAAQSDPTKTGTSDPFNVNSPAPITITLRPNAAGSTTQLDDRGTTPNYACVDEAVSDGTATYVRGTGDDSWQDDSYNIQDQALSGTITQVRIYINVQKEGSSTSSMLSARTVIRLGSGTMAYGTPHDSLPSSWTTYSDSYANKPSQLGGGAWTWADINNLQIGVGLRSHDSYQSGWTYAECTQVWVEITYTPS